ncbi:MAG TPA: TadE/TadG family type IV pilus assembly protein [Brevundimonas sp.]|jgi:Flp pilus assembly protein TadG|uniref:TadE/TadG family type IV pilus assembly protein n=1 Tax=Brevundimonas sp. TaxID=1871086 RepID=UPI002DE9080C|nr:TadE/TadG family type IV pilus assembly protein [Brevundimonas sp.]
METTRRKADAMAARLHALRHDRGGASAVEFAIVAPIFLLLLCGICVYSVWFVLAIGVQSLAVEGARASLAGLDDAERRALAVAHVRSHAADAGLAPARLTQVVTVAPDATRVTVRFDASDHPVMALKTLIPSPPSTIERTAVVSGNG